MGHWYLHYVNGFHASTSSQPSSWTSCMFRRMLQNFYRATYKEFDIKITQSVHPRVCLMRYSTTCFLCRASRGRHWGGLIACGSDLAGEGLFLCQTQGTRVTCHTLHLTANLTDKPLIWPRHHCFTSL